MGIRDGRLSANINAGGTGEGGTVGGGRDWLVVHTLARCEKQVLAWAEREGLQAALPTYASVRRYRGKVMRFEKVLFPGYLFLVGTEAEAGRLRQNRHVAQVLVPPDRDEFRRQLGEILAAVSAGVDLRPAMEIQPGVRVRIVSGPLGGMEGWVERLEAPLEVVLRLDFIGQSAAVRVELSDVEPM